MEGRGGFLVLCFGLLRDHPDARRAGTGTDHRGEIRAAFVFRPIRIVDAIVIGPSTGSKVTSLVTPAAVIRPAENLQKRSAPPFPEISEVAFRALS